MANPNIPAFIAFTLKIDGRGLSSLSAISTPNEEIWDKKTSSTYKHVLIHKQKFKAQIYCALINSRRKDQKNRLKWRFAIFVCMWQKSF